MIKSGTDFREFSYIQISLNNEQHLINKIEKYVIDSKIEEKQDIKLLIDSYLGKL